MDITEEDKGGFVRLAVSGRIDTGTAPQFEERLLSHLTGDGRSVVVDMTQVDFVSSAGLRVFLMGAKKIKGTPANLVLCGMTENVQKVFSMSGFDRILEIRDTPEAGESRMAELQGT